MTNIEIILTAVIYIAIAVTIATICGQDEDSFLWDVEHVRQCAVKRVRVPARNGASESSPTTVEIEPLDQTQAERKLVA